MTMGFRVPDALQSLSTLFIAAAAAILGAAARHLRGRGRDSHKRGVVLVEGRRRARARRRGGASLTLAGCVIPFRDET